MLSIWLRTALSGEETGNCPGDRAFRMLDPANVVYLPSRSRSIPLWVGRFLMLSCPLLAILSHCCLSLSLSFSHVPQLVLPSSC